MVLVIGVVLIYLFLARSSDQIGTLLPRLPTLWTVARAMNLDQVWFGAILAKLLEDGSFTPYIGLNIFASESVVGQSLPLAAIIRGVTYFIHTTRSSSYY